ADDDIGAVLESMDPLDRIKLYVRGKFPRQYDALERGHPLRVEILPLESRDPPLVRSGLVRHAHAAPSGRRIAQRDGFLAGEIRRPEAAEKTEAVAGFEDHHVAEIAYALGARPGVRHISCVAFWLGRLERLLLAPREERGGMIHEPDEGFPRE